VCLDRTASVQAIGTLFSSCGAQNLDMMGLGAGSGWRIAIGEWKIGRMEGWKDGGVETFGGWSVANIE
jgi:hypothetical protein